MLIVTSSLRLSRRALDAVDISWENEHLKNILSNDEYYECEKDDASGPALAGSRAGQPYPKFNEDGQPLWHGETCQP